MRCFFAVLLAGAILSSQVGVAYTACRTFMVSSADCAVPTPDHCADEAEAATTSAAACQEICQVVAEKLPALSNLPVPVVSVPGESSEPGASPASLQSRTSSPTGGYSSSPPIRLFREQGEVYLLNAAFLI